MILNYFLDCFNLARLDKQRCLFKKKKIILLSSYCQMGIVHDEKVSSNSSFFHLITKLSKFKLSTVNVQH